MHIFVPVVPATAARRSPPPRARSPPARRRSTRRWPPTAYVVEEREGKVFVDATRAGGATVVAAYCPRIRPGAPVSFPVDWDELERVDPAAFTIKTAPTCSARATRGRRPCRSRSPCPRSVEEGRAIPIARVAAMHEGKRRKSAARNEEQRGRDRPPPARAGSKPRAGGCAGGRR